MPELNKAIVAYAPNTTMVHNVTCIRASEMRFCGLTHTPKIFPLVPNPSAMPSSAIEPIRPPIGNASDKAPVCCEIAAGQPNTAETVSYTHLRAHETGRNLVCRLLLE